MIRVAVIGNTNCLCDNMKLVSKYDDYDILLVSYMSCTMLAECALGLNDDFAVAFLKDKPICVLNSGLQYKKIIDKAVFQMYSVYRRKLQSFGVKFIESVNNIRNDKNDYRYSKGKCMGDKKG